MTESSTPSSTSAKSTSTRYFWYGYLIGGGTGVVFGYFMGDILGWIYMCGTIGCIAALPFERPS